MQFELDKQLNRCISKLKFDITAFAWWKWEYLDIHIESMSELYIPPNKQKNIVNWIHVIWGEAVIHHRKSNYIRQIECFKINQRHK